MLKRLKNILTGTGPVEEPRLERERIQVATCVILLEMATADSEFQREERQIIDRLLREKFALSSEAAEELMELADREREASLDLQQFTREINDGFSREEKFEIMETLWRIVYADGVVDKFEDHLVRKLAFLLRLSHREMIDCKIRVLEETRSPSKKS